MNRINHLLWMFAMVVAVLLPACKENPIEPSTPTPPDVRVKITSLTRTEVAFTIESYASDYVYAILPKGETPTDAKAFFKEGKCGYLEKAKATVVSTDIEGGQEYQLVVATRQINPYNYSEITVVDLSTNLPYTSPLTIEKVGETCFGYHVEMPASAKKMKHVAVKKVDFEAIKAMLQQYGNITLASYLKVFGHEITESQTFMVDKLGKTGLNDDILVHPGLEYYVLLGEPDSNGDIPEDKIITKLITTKEFAKSSHKLNAEVSTTSTSISIKVNPDPEIESYRLAVAARADYDYTLREGMAQWKANIVGYWDDSLNLQHFEKQHEYKGATTITMGGLRPQSNYVVGIIGYDKQGAEVFVNEVVMTSEPVGPLPEITITSTIPQSNCPWNSAAYNVKVKNGVALHVGFFPKSAVDRKLAEGVSLEDLVRNNAEPVDAKSLKEAQSAAGCVFEINTLDANTEYYFAAYAENDEFIGKAQMKSFKTEAPPRYGGEVRNNMPGRYTAKSTDSYGRTISFPVTIATGVNEATTAAYEAANRLVCLGFGSANKYPVKLPADLVAAGKSEQEANALYGPKWFIEFTPTAIKVPSVRDQETRGFSWAMCEQGGKPVYFMGFGTTDAGSVKDSSSYEWPVTVSADGKTITLDAIDSTFGYNFFPSMGTANDWYSGTAVYRCYSKLTLTRNADDATLKRGALTAPRRYQLKLSEVQAKSTRRAVASKFNAK